MSRDDPIREYFEEDLPDKRFHEQNERLQMAIDRNLGWLGDKAEKAWKRDWNRIFKEDYSRIKDEWRKRGLVHAVQSLTGDGAGLAFVRWTGCLWHLLVEFRTDPPRAISACGGEFPVGERVEGKVDTDPHQYLTCMECWEHVEALRVAQVLSGDGDEGEGGFCY